MTEPALEMRGIVKSYGATRALQGVDFRVDKGSIHALLGQNGAGKSTLLKVAVGATAPDAGEVLVDGRELHRASTGTRRRSGVGMVFQELSVLPDLSVADNVFLGDEHRTSVGLIDRRRQIRETAQMFERLGERIDPLVPLGKLSAGDQQMVEIVKALRLARSVLILDEPTAALTEDEVHRLFTVLRQIARSGVGLVYVSHRLTEVAALCDEVTVLRDGKIAASGPTAQVGVDKIVSIMVGEGGADRTDAVVERRSKPGEGEALMAVRGLAVQPKLRDVSFDLRPGEVVGVAGLAGSGRSVLLKSLYGVIRSSAGEVRVKGRVVTLRSPAAAIRAGLYLIPEKRHAEGLVLEHSVEANLSLSILKQLRRAGFYDGRHSEARARELVDGLGIRCRGVRQPVLHLSGGNQQKVVLGKAFNAAASILLLDEPTYGVDVHATAEIRRRIRGFADEGNAVLWVTSDVRELLAVADRFLILADGTVKDSLPNGPGTTEAELTHAIQPGHERAHAEAS
jgi:ribose transport system ATP-binding protein